VAVGTRTVARVGVTFDVSADEEYREFWDWYESDGWEPDTVAAFEGFLRPDTRYVDLGAWIGPTVLLAAATVAVAVCAEPDPRAYAVLGENLARNPGAAAKTTAMHVAVGPVDCTVALTSPGIGGDSNSSVVRVGDAGAKWQVAQVTFRTLLERCGLDDADFVKLDVEGAEYELVPAMLADFSGRPTLFVAMHPNLLVDKRSIRARVGSSFRALRLNHRFLRAVLVYRHHYVYDERQARFRDVRKRDLVRVLLPLPLRASFLIGACVFTNDPVA
jgi:FkbM family methyltransferase